MADDRRSIAYGRPSPKLLDRGPLFSEQGSRYQYKSAEGPANKDRLQEMSRMKLPNDPEDQYDDARDYVEETRVRRAIYSSDEDWKFERRTISPMARIDADIGRIDYTISEDHSVGPETETRKLSALQQPSAERSGRQAPPRSLPYIPVALSSRRSPSPNQRWSRHRSQSRERIIIRRKSTSRTRLPRPATKTESSEVHRSSQMLEQDVGEFQRIMACDDISSSDWQKLRKLLELSQNDTQHFERTERSRRLKPRCQSLYRLISEKEVDASLSPKFLDHPRWLMPGGEAGVSVVQCSMPLLNFELFLEKNKDLSFLTYFDFNRKSRREDSVDTMSSESPPRPTAESVSPIDRDLIAAIEFVLSSEDSYKEDLRVFRTTGELLAPYAFIYHSRHKFDTLMKSKLSEDATIQFCFFRDYVMDRFGHEYDLADSLFSRGKVTPKTLPYLFKSGAILIGQQRGEYRGYVAKSLPYTTESSALPLAADVLKAFNVNKSEKQVSISYRVEVWHWAFDGQFQRQKATRALDFVIKSVKGRPAGEVIKPDSEQEYIRRVGADSECDITDLDLFPSEYAPPEVLERLRQRGRTFWKCRGRRLVSYQATGTTSIESPSEERHMIDTMTYRSLHPQDVRDFHDELGPEVLARDEPPGDEFELLVPLTIKGYNLRRKKWYDLDVDRISDVKWNKESFKKLVIDRKARDLIEALITKQVAVEKSTDFIKGKGNGLILLLHGGPGTGKTLTAESVAEMAEKPLYRVTCGDVGTQAEKVETYLESVLHLGKIWGCVVLLDEADVFLEQRSLEDLARNALVSVFLRILEYYEGILVLTSNRVGTFDEAFKSRIQLALHYPSLGEYQRLRIWEMFIDRLESFNDDTLDIADLRDHLEDLKKVKMNGREIRNAITIARQYTDWKGVKLTYEHLKDVIDISSRFDTYLSKLNHGYSPEELAMDVGIR